MKTLRVLTIALAGLAIVSCAKTEPVSTRMEQSDQLITFAAPITTPATKARNVVTGTTFPTTTAIKVASVWYDGTWTDWNTDTEEYIGLQNASFSAAIGTKGAWTTSSPYYWPKSGKLAFSAFAPAIDEGTIGANGLANFTNYTVKTDGTQVDLMYSDLVTEATKASHTAGTTYEGVQLNFNHALANVEFSAKTDKAYDDSKVVIEIKSIVLKNVKNKGTFNGTAWTPSGDNAAYSNIAKADIPVTVNGNAMDFYAADSELVKDMLVLPQAFVVEDEQDAEVEVIYTVQVDGKAVVETVYSKNLSELTFSTATNAFEKAKTYKLTIVIGLDQIYFSPEVVDWTEIHATDVTVD